MTALAGVLPALLREGVPSTSERRRMPNIAIMGAGVMGRCAAERIIQAGHPLIVFDVNPEALERAVALGAARAASPAAAARVADLVLLYLPGPVEVAGCVNGPEGLLETLRPGTIITDQSTVSPGTSRSLAAAANARSVGYLDAPVLGRPVSVGRWALVVGGEPADLERCRPVLELLASRIFHLGPSGSGNQVKLLNQMMFGAINAMTAEMMAIAAQAGIAPRQLYETITASQAGTVSNLFKELGARIAEERYENPTFSVDLLIKDVRLAGEMAGEFGAPPLLGRMVEFINEVARSQGFGPLDTAVMWKCFQPMWGKTGDQ